ncbi:phosphate acetyltransferase [Candidatus Peregrinibacteria bacterium CG_4_9_14_0_2_um_filter_53_11]|nr:MAG: phosphate acetyltransferase [Candidatus Peregrinibacteria bacterium CG_4_9_14_0_2_um_filter_53_11]
MKSFLIDIQKQAQANPARIVFPETFDDRTLQACAQVAQLGTGHPVLLGKPAEIWAAYERLGIEINRDEFEIIDWQGDTERRNRYARQLVEIRKSKGMTLEEAEKLMDNLNYFAVMVIESGDAQALITGANVPSHDTLRPALQIIKTKEKFHKVSGFFFMILEDQLLLFADCMVNIEPTAQELAEIAIDTAETALRFGIEPRIAMLSFSTNGSADHPHVKRVQEAVARVNHMRPELLCEGEMQVDAALVPAVAEKKMPGSKIAGRANVLIFPNLEAANISYKLVERLGGAKAIGPILQGLRKPVNDLSRGCSVQDIVDLAAISSVELLPSLSPTHPNPRGK